jgi:hypothetical protein
LFSGIFRRAISEVYQAGKQIRKIEHEYSLKDKLDPAWAVRPLEPFPSNNERLDYSRARRSAGLFLDDFQWLDAATLDLLEDLLTRTDVHN